jgi:16S rRNA (adenine1518-N6/adenine1519-N6)-dimethyltransferase
MRPESRRNILRDSVVTGGPKAKKSLGQHFLRRPDTARRIVDLLEIGPEDRVLEIGPGPGALSGFLRAAGPALLALVEKDRYWAFERQQAGEGRVVLADATLLAWERITLARPWKIVGNLPYNVASFLIWDILSRAPGLSRAVFMVQKEVALRLAAEPGGKSYGALSVWTRSFALPKTEFILGPAAFAPPPRVDSAVVSFTPLPPDERPERPKALAALLKLCFQHRRKQLGTVFTMHGMARVLPILRTMGIDPRSRPETLSPQLFRKLSTQVY